MLVLLAIIGAALAGMQVQVLLYVCMLGIANYWRMWEGLLDPLDLALGVPSVPTEFLGTGPRLYRVVVSPTGIKDADFWRVPARFLINAHHPFEVMLLLKAHAPNACFDCRRIS